VQKQEASHATPKQKVQRSVSEWAAQISPVKERKEHTNSLPLPDGGKGIPAIYLSPLPEKENIESPASAVGILAIENENMKIRNANLEIERDNLRERVTELSSALEELGKSAQKENAENQMFIQELEASLHEEVSGRVDVETQLKDSIDELTTLKEAVLHREGNPFHEEGTIMTAPVTPLEKSQQVEILQLHKIADDAIQECELTVKKKDEREIEMKTLQTELEIRHSSMESLMHSHKELENELLKQNRTNESQVGAIIELESRLEDMSDSLKESHQKSVEIDSKKQQDNASMNRIKALGEELAKVELERVQDLEEFRKCEQERAEERAYFSKQAEVNLTQLLIEARTAGSENEQVHPKDITYLESQIKWAQQTSEGYQGTMITPVKAKMMELELETTKPEEHTLRCQLQERDAELNESRNKIAQLVTQLEEMQHAQKQLTTVWEQKKTPEASSMEMLKTEPEAGMIELSQCKHELNAARDELIHSTRHGVLLEEAALLSAKQIEGFHTEIEALTGELHAQQVTIQRLTEEVSMSKHVENLLQHHFESVKDLLCPRTAKKSEGKSDDIDPSHPLAPRSPSGSPKLQPTAVADDKSASPIWSLVSGVAGWVGLSTSSDAGGEYPESVLSAILEKERAEIKALLETCTELQHKLKLQKLEADNVSLKQMPVDEFSGLESSMSQDKSLIIEKLESRLEDCYMLINSLQTANTELQEKQIELRDADELVDELEKCSTELEFKTHAWAEKYETDSDRWTKTADDLRTMNKDLLTENEELRKDYKQLRRYHETVKARLSKHEDVEKSPSPVRSSSSHKLTLEIEASDVIPDLNIDHPATDAEVQKYNALMAEVVSLRSELTLHMKESTAEIAKYEKSMESLKKENTEDHLRLQKSEAVAQKVPQLERQLHENVELMEVSNKELKDSQDRVQILSQNLTTAEELNRKAGKDLEEASKRARQDVTRRVTGVEKTLSLRMEDLKVASQTVMELDIKLKEYKKLNDDLTLGNRQIPQLQQQLVQMREVSNKQTSASQKVKQLEASLQEALEMNEKCMESSNATLKVNEDQLDILETDLHSVKSKLTEMQIAHTEIQQQLDETSAREQKLSQDLEDATSQNKELTQDLEEKVRKLRIVSKEAKSPLKDAKSVARVAELEKKLTDADKAHDEDKQVVRLAKNKVNEAITQLTDTKSHCNTLQVEIEEAKRELSEKEAKIEELTTEMLDWRDKHGMDIEQCFLQKETEISEVKAAQAVEMKTYKVKCDELSMRDASCFDERLQLEIDSLKAENSLLEEKIDQVKADKIKLNVRITTLTKECSELRVSSKRASAISNDENTEKGSQEHLALMARLNEENAKLIERAETAELALIEAGSIETANVMESGDSETSNIASKPAIERLSPEARKKPSLQKSLEEEWEEHEARKHRDDADNKCVSKSRVEISVPLTKVLEKRRTSKDPASSDLINKTVVETTTSRPMALMLKDLESIESCDNYVSPMKLSRRLKAEMVEVQGDMEDARVAIHMQHELIAALEAETASQKSLEANRIMEMSEMKKENESLQYRVFDLEKEVDLANHERDASIALCQNEAKARKMKWASASMDERLEDSMKDLRSERDGLRRATEAALINAFQDVSERM